LLYDYAYTTIQSPSGDSSRVTPLPAGIVNCEPRMTFCGKPGTKVASWALPLMILKLAPGDAAPAPEPSIVTVCIACLSHLFPSF
jgi:hypothetical protein